MNDYQEYRSYGSYLSRVFAIIVAFLLLVFAIWAIVRVASDDDETLGDTSAPSASENRDSEDDDLFVANTTDEDGAVVANNTAGDDSEGQTLSTNTDIAAAEAARDGNSVAGASTDSANGNLPTTGANPMIVVALGAAAFFGTKLYYAREN